MTALKRFDRCSIVVAPANGAAPSIPPYGLRHLRPELARRALSVSLGEDASRVRSGAAPHVLATWRNTVLTVLQAHGYSEIAATSRHLARHLARHRDEALALVGLTRQ